MKIINKNIQPINSKRELHGYQEWYWTNGQIWMKGVYKHGQRFGYLESHNANRTNFYIK